MSIRWWCSVPLAIAAAACGPDRSTAPNPPNPPVPPVAVTVHGSVAAPAGGSLSGLEFMLRVGSGASLQSFTTPADAAGAFVLNASVPLATGDSVDMIIDAMPGTPRRYRPVYARRTSASIATYFARALLVPRTVDVSTPTYAATGVNVSLDQAFQKICEDATNPNCSSFFPQYWKTNVPLLWDDDQLPVRVAFDRGNSTAPISDADSVAFWTLLRRLETDIGRSIFAPADYAAVPPPNALGYSSGTVFVSVDSTLIAQHFSGYTNWVALGRSLYGARVRYAKAANLGVRTFVSHEFGHVIGLQHSCAWSSFMSGGYVCPWPAGPTLQDVAAINLAYVLRATMVKASPTTTLADAQHGEVALEGPSASASRAPDGATTSPSAVPRGGEARRSLLVDGRRMTIVGTP